ncbi:hypothetical protein B0H13DRAFT_1908055 [Mycena leptocephala]|nr:hypothetical protein B0H13DRAFT_1908055 [Mycena leptocephala]
MLAGISTIGLLTTLHRWLLRCTTIGWGAMVVRVLQFKSSSSFNLCWIIGLSMSGNFQQGGDYGEQTSRVPYRMVDTFSKSMCPPALRCKTEINFQVWIVDHHPFQDSHWKPQTDEPITFLAGVVSVHLVVGLNYNRPKDRFDQPKLKELTLDVTINVTECPNLAASA